MVHNRRQKSITNSLFDIVARAFGIETPASRYRRVIIYIYSAYIPRTRISLYILRVHVIYLYIYKYIKDFSKVRNIFEYITCTRSKYKEIRVLSISI